MLMLWLTTLIISGFHIDGFGNYVWATILVWVVNTIIDVLLVRTVGSGGSRASVTPGAAY